MFLPAILVSLVLAVATLAAPQIPPITFNTVVCRGTGFGFDAATQREAATRFCTSASSNGPFRVAYTYYVGKVDSK